MLADKPMAKKKLLLYDIVTERFETTNALQRELTMIWLVLKLNINLFCF
jgi:hypothetical protein